MIAPLHLNTQSRCHPKRCASCWGQQTMNTRVRRYSYGIPNQSRRPRAAGYLSQRAGSFRKHSRSTPRGTQHRGFLFEGVGMSNIETGGSAFPCPMSEQTHSNQDCAPFQGGMTLRDYFAAKAMHAFIRSAPNGTAFGTSEGAANERYAAASYTMADAMLRARGVQ